MADEVYVELPDVLVVDVEEDEGVEEVENFRSGTLTQAVDITLGIAAVAGSLATVVVAVDAVQGFVRRLCRAVLRRTAPAENGVQLTLTVRGAAGETTVAIDIRREGGDTPTEADVAALTAAISAAFNTGSRPAEG